MYFEGYWYNKVKPLELYKVKKGSYPDAQRNVEAQPLVFMGNFYNVRKIMEYPYHLLFSEQFQKCVQDCFCKFEFMRIYITVFSVSAFMVDLRLAMKMMDEAGDLGPVYHDIETLYNIISIEADTIRKDNNQLAVLVSFILMKCLCRLVKSHNFF